MHMYLSRVYSFNPGSSQPAHMKTKEKKWKNLVYFDHVQDVAGHQLIISARLHSHTYALHCIHVAHRAADAYIHAANT